MGVLYVDVLIIRAAMQFGVYIGLLIFFGNSQMELPATNRGLLKIRDPWVTPLVITVSAWGPKLDSS